MSWGAACGISEGLILLSPPQPHRRDGTLLGPHLGPPLGFVCDCHAGGPHRGAGGQEPLCRRKKEGGAGPDGSRTTQDHGRAAGRPPPAPSLPVPEAQRLSFPSHAPAWLSVQMSQRTRRPMQCFGAKGQAALAVGREGPPCSRSRGGSSAQAVFLELPGLSTLQPPCGVHDCSCHILWPVTPHTVLSL